MNNHESLAAKINSFQVHHTHETRAIVNQELRGPYYNRTKGQNSFIYREIKFWNSTPLELRNIPNDVNAFKDSSCEGFSAIYLNCRNFS